MGLCGGAFTQKEYQHSAKLYYFKAKFLCITTKVSNLNQESLSNLDFVEAMLLCDCQTTEVRLFLALQTPLWQQVHLVASHLEALDASQVVQLLCRLH